jgi:hypothetical protein
MINENMRKGTGTTLVLIGKSRTMVLDGALSIAPVAEGEIALSRRHDQ